MVKHHDAREGLRAFPLQLMAGVLSSPPREGLSVPALPDARSRVVF
jgi:hypothetical protein